MLQQQLCNRTRWPSFIHGNERWGGSPDTCQSLPWITFWSVLYCALSARPFSAAMQIIAFPDSLLGLDRLYTLYRSSIATLSQQGLHRQSRTDRWKLQVQGVRWICSVCSIRHHQHLARQHHQLYLLAWHRTVVAIAHAGKQCPCLLLEQVCAIAVVWPC